MNEKTINDMKNLLLSAFSLAMVVLLPAILVAQPSDPEPVPIDGGVGFLAAAGVAYGVKKYRDMRKGKAE